MSVSRENVDHEADDDQKIHSFIIRLWLEKTKESQTPIYRGYVVRLPDRQRYYITRLEEIITLIQNALDENQAAI